MKRSRATIAGAIPCLNAASTLPKAISSLQNQTQPVSTLLMVDDGSSDGSAAVAESAGARTIPTGGRMGRGAARAAAMRSADADLVVFCDATCELPPDFIERGIRWFDDPRVAAVCGTPLLPPPRNAVERWRSRHLFREGTPPGPRHGAALVTFGCILRSAAVDDAGGFDPALREREDADLGARLLARGHDIVADPTLRITTHKSDTLWSVLERYARWNTEGPVGAWEYLRLIGFSLRVMALRDLKCGDPAAACLSLLCPHYQLLWSLRKSRGRRPCPPPNSTR